MMIWSKTSSKICLIGTSILLIRIVTLQDTMCPINKCLTSLSLLLFNTESHQRCLNTCHQPKLCMIFHKSSHRRVLNLRPKRRYTRKSSKIVLNTSTLLTSNKCKTKLQLQKSMAKSLSCITMIVSTQTKKLLRCRSPQLSSKLCQRSENPLLSLKR